MQDGKISLALGGAKKAVPPKHTNGTKRSHASLREDDDDDHEFDRPQKVSHFDKQAGGAIDESKPKTEEGPLIIAPQANRDWREASKRRKQGNGLPTEAQNIEASRQAVAELEKGLEEPQYGLNITKRDPEDEHRELITRRRAPGDGEPVINGRDAQAEAEATQQQASEPNGDALVKIKTDEEEAIEALLGQTKRSDLVLPSVSEEEAFSQDYHSAPDMASLDDYDRVPVEQFGAALLRGMGWKDGEDIGAQRGKKAAVTKMPERRPAFLGIGAKEEAAVAQEMGSWGRAAKDRKGAPQVYNPILLRDKKTGEMFTEEELQKKKERDERARYEEEFERKERRRRRDDEDEGDGRSRRGERERKRERSGQRRRRDTSEDLHYKDKDRARRRRDDDVDGEDYRRAEKERRRREREHGDYDRERSRRYDGDHEPRRERDRRR